MMHEMDRGHYDYLHGALGGGLYFLKKEITPTIRKDIEELIDQLNILDKEGKKKWHSYYKEGKKDSSTNLGLSHGIPSILVFLLKAYQLNINKQASKDLIEDIVIYLLDNTQDTAIYGSYYAYTVSEITKDNPHNTRLAWCYGDLGVCCALWQAAQTFNDYTLKGKVLEMMCYNASRKDLEDNMIYDAGLCHGTAGIAHIFNRFYQDTHITLFKETALFWFEKTLKLATFQDGLAGYKACASNTSKQYEKCAGLLEGITGIGLALIGAVSDFEPAWDECLLIS